MNIVEIIKKKRDNQQLTKEEIEYFIQSLVEKKIEPYHASALLMAIYLNGMNIDETYYLTMAMKNSGEVYDLSMIQGLKVDKHSTGGVGDKVTLVLGPILAACGLVFAKMSGRALAHTGGTIDKLESIGANTDLSHEKFIEQMQTIKLAVVGQNKNLVPADKILYALRDVTATVDSYPLIASSIMSKKLAANCDVILLDVKYGEGAFMKDLASAEKLARIMIGIGNRAGKKIKAVLSNMNQPLGNTVGNIIEVIEAKETLLNKGPKDFTDLCISSAAILLVQAELFDNIEQAIDKVKEVLENGSAYKLFKQFLMMQDVSEELLDNLEDSHQYEYSYQYFSPNNGYIHQINALKIGLLAMKLGAGRIKVNDQIDFHAGIRLNYKVGDYVEKNQLLATLYSNKPISSEMIDDLTSAYQIEKDYIDKQQFKEILIEGE